MNPQFDHSTRIVSLDNLEAMCKRVSGMCHRFEIVKQSNTRVVVEYSNPNEYGSPDPIRATYPCFPYAGAVAVALSAIKVSNCSGRNEGMEQAFDQLEDCEVLWRDPVSGKWQTEYEILVTRHPEFAVTSTWIDQCTQVWHCQGQDFRNGWREAQAFAVKAMKLLK